MKVILVDDEPMALEVLENMILPYKDINIIGSYTRTQDALESIKEVQPDIIFLDIEMGNMNGLELAGIFMQRLDEVQIIFVTAYSQYAVDAFELNAIDYLLKPIQEKRLLKAIERLREKNIKGTIKDRNKTILENSLKVRSFGGFQVFDTMENPLKWRTKKSKELFAYLWEKKENSVSKDKILEDVFSNKDLDKAATLLHTTIYQLRKKLRELGYSNSIIFFDESYQLNIPINSDLEEFNKLINLKVSIEDIKKLLEIYIGDFLEEGYHWATGLQQIYRAKFLNKIEEFAKKQVAEEKLDLTLKISLDKAYQIDSYNKVIVESILHYYGIKNKQASLEKFFNNYAKNLWREMELKPIESTINIYKGYMKGKHLDT